MTKKLNFLQLVLLADNGSHSLVSQHMTYEETVDVFFSHVQAYTASLSVSFLLAEPFLTSDFQEPIQSSYVYVDDTPLGEFFLFHHSVPTFSSLVYSSSLTQPDMALLQKSRFSSLTIPQYLSILQTLTERLLFERNTHPSSLD